MTIRIPKRGAELLYIGNGTEYLCPADPVQHIGILGLLRPSMVINTRRMAQP